MTPERRAASRLGWVAILGAIGAVGFIIVTPPVWYISGPLAVLLGVILSVYEPALYSWVTAPEREGDEDPLS